ncbi:MAG: HEAT repeat domain-containing protein [Planctomycetota bacterium]
MASLILLFERRTRIAFIVVWFSWALGPEQVLGQAEQGQSLETRAAELHEKLLVALESADLPEDFNTCGGILKEMHALGPEARCALPTLKRIAISNKWWSHHARALLLAMGNESKEVLRELLTHEDPLVRAAVLLDFRREPSLEIIHLHRELLAIGNMNHWKFDEKYANRDEVSLGGGLRGLVAGRDDGLGGFGGGQVGLSDFGSQMQFLDQMAVEALIFCGYDQPDLLEHLMQGLQNAKNPRCYGLADLGKPAFGAIARLRQLARYGPPSMRPGTAEYVLYRNRATEILTAVDRSGKVCFQVLLEQMKEPVDDGFFGIDPFALGESCPKPLEWLLGHPARSQVDGQQLLDAIQALEPNEQVYGWMLLAECNATLAIPYLRSVFENSDSQYSQHKIVAATALARLDPNSEDAFLYLVQILDDEKLAAATTRDPNPFGFGGMQFEFIHPIRADAARALGYVHPKYAQRAFNALNKFAKHREDNKLTLLAAFATWSLIRLDRENETAVQSLNTDGLPFAMRTDEEGIWHYETPESVAQVLGDRIDQVIDLFVHQALSTEPHEEERSEFALKVLLAAKPARIRPLVEAAFQAIETQESYVDRNTGPVRVLIETLPRLGPATDIVIEQTESSNYEARKLAVYMLGKLRTQPLQAIAALRKACSDSRALVRARATASLAAYGGQANSALPELRELLRDDFASVRNAAKNAIASIAGTMAK